MCVYVRFKIWLVKSGIGVVWKVLGYVTISNVLLTCCLSVLCGCGGVGVGWGRLVDGFPLGVNLGVNLGLVFGALYFCSYFVLIIFHNFDDGLFGIVLNFRAESCQFYGNIELCNVIRAVRNEVEGEWQVFSW